MSYDPEKITFFAKTDARGQNTPFGIKAKDRSRHVYVIGKTGMGKSTLLENMAVQDIQNGEGIAFIDPHGATAEKLLDYVPEERKDDVLYFAPFDMEYPISFNVMEDVGPDKRHLVVSGLMSVFEKIWVDVWSARMAYILQNTLMALLEYPDSTLLGVNRMLSDKDYRKVVVDHIQDPSVKSFWVDEFAKYNERYMQEAGDSIKNKIGQFTANPLIRNIIGQSKSSFDIRKIIDDKKIFIMNLSKGLVGESNANLLGSMLTTRIYLAAMSRADLPQAEVQTMPNFYFYVDEFQSFANATFADILSEARKYKLNLTIAHQYIEQMEEEVRNAVFGNVGTIISFRVGPFDAEVLETIYSPQFWATDICNLGFAQVYMTLMIDGIGSKPFSAVTLPPIEPASISCKDMVLHSSREQFANSRAEVEEKIFEWLGQKQLPVEKNTRGGNRNREEGGSGGRNDGGKNGNGEKSRSEKSKESRESREQRESREPRREQRREQRSENEEKREERVVTESERKPKKDKRINDLRAVLKGISAIDESKKSNVDDKKDRGQDKTHTPHKSESDETQSKDSSLKDALKNVLRGVDSGIEKRVEKSDAQIDDAQAHKSMETEPPNPSSREDASWQTEVEVEVEGDNREEQIASEKPERQTYSASETQNDNPLDPKKLERMMKVTTSDRTPLK